MAAGEFVVAVRLSPTDYHWLDRPAGVASVDF